MARVSEGEQEGRHALAARLREYLRAVAPEHPACGLLVMRPGGQASAGEASAPLPPTELARLTERIRTRIRRTDQVIAEPRYGMLAIVLHGAGSAGARAVAERLCAALDRGTTIPGTYPPETQLALGYSSARLLTPRDSAQLVRAAWRTQRLITVNPSEPLPSRTRKPSHDSARIITLDAPVTRASHGERRTPLVALEREPRKMVAVEARPDGDALREAARALGVPYAQIPARLPEACRRAIAPELARALRAVPIGRTRGVLTVAMQNPRDTCSVQRLRDATGLTVFPVLADAEEIERALAQLAGE